jgi:pimeloyl-[acyl-carrier protein] synthase
MSPATAGVSLAFDLFSPAFHADPFPTYRAMREQAPFYAMAFGGSRALFATRFADVERLISDERLTMNMTAWDGYRREGPDDPRARLARVALDSMSVRDGAEHTRLRRLVNQGFTPRAMAAFDASLAALVRERVARVAALDRFDLHRDLSQRVPVIAIARLLGVPEADEARFASWADRMIHAADPFASDAIVTDGADARDELDDYLDALLAQRRAAPRADLLSELLAAQDGAERLTSGEIRALCQTLLIAGSETTTNLIDLGVKALIDFPAVRAELAADPARVPAMVEETLRFDHPGKFLSRVAREEIALGAGVLPKGGLVLCGIGAAHRDPARFRDPDRFDLGRDPREAIAFGKGRHSCLGARLARREGELVLAAVLPWIAQLRYDADAIVWRQSLIVRGMESFPIARTG